MLSCLAMSCNVSDPCTLIPGNPERKCQLAPRKTRLCWTTNSTSRRATNPRDRASDVHFVAGHPAKRICGPAAAATSGIPSIPVEYVPPAFTSGLQRNAFRALAGRHTRIGTPRDRCCVRQQEASGLGEEERGRCNPGMVSPMPKHGKSIEKAFGGT
jgi:hypothetical protein